jgi:aspartate aminotransferase-like enzyme
MRSRQLFTPGPTEVPWRVREKLAGPMIHHRTEEFRAIQREAIDDLRDVLKTRNPVLLLACSGTGAMEAALVNLTTRGEKVLVTDLGKFSHRWREIGEAYGLDVTSVEARWGDPVRPEELERALDANPGVKSVFTIHSETSTGVLQDIESMARIARSKGALIVVDAITSVGAERLETDAWGLDVVIGSSQKGVMTPPGLAFLSLSEAARERMDQPGQPSYYFDMKRALASYEKGDSPWTPPIGLVMGLHEALKMIKEEGLESVIERHARNARAARAAVRALGLEVFPTVPAACTTAVAIPEGHAEQIRKHLHDVYGIRIAGGQGRLKGKIVRIGHLGHYFESDIFTVVSAFESTLLDLGLIDSGGRGVEALFKQFHEM